MIIKMKPGLVIKYSMRICLRDIYFAITIGRVIDEDEALVEDMSVDGDSAPDRSTKNLR